MAETEPQEVPDQNIDQSEETKVSETDVTKETEENQNEEAPTSAKEQASPGLKYFIKIFSYFIDCSRLKFISMLVLCCRNMFKKIFEF